MNIFVAFKIIIIVVIVYSIIGNYHKLKKKVLNPLQSGEDSKKRKFMYKFYFLTYIEAFIVGITFSFVWIFNDGDVFEFANNVNDLASSYYKEVDKKELLNKAFVNILEGLDDPYTGILDQGFKDSISQKNDEFGYTVDIREDGAVLIFNDTKKENKIISFDGINIERNEFKRNTRNF